MSCTLNVRSELCVSRWGKTKYFKEKILSKKRKEKEESFFLIKIFKNNLTSLFAHIIFRKLCLNLFGLLFTNEGLDEAALTRALIYHHRDLTKDDYKG